MGTQGLRKLKNFRFDHFKISHIVFYEKDVHEDEEISKADVLLYKDWIASMVAVSAARSIHEYGEELITQQGQPEIDAD